MKGMTNGKAKAVADHGQGLMRATIDVVASPERVFAALASREILQWWVRPRVFDTRKWTGEVRAGGRWQASGMGARALYTLEGEFLEIDRPTRLGARLAAAGHAEPADEGHLRPGTAGQRNARDPRAVGLHLGRGVREHRDRLGAELRPTRRNPGGRVAELARLIDHTLLDPAATSHDVLMTFPLCSWVTSLPDMIELGEVGGTQVQPDGAEVFLEMAHPRGARDRQHRRRMGEQPGERDLGRRRLMPLGDLGHDPAGPRQLTNLERVPGDERHIFARAILQHRLGGPVQQAVAVLH